MHASDIPSVLDTLAARYGKELTPTDPAVAHAVHTYWVGFAKSGVPEAPGQLAWNSYDPKTDLIMEFTTKGPVLAPDTWGKRTLGGEIAGGMHFSICVSQSIRATESPGLQDGSM